MIREFKMTIKSVGANFCNIYCETRDDYGTWEKQGVIPTLGTFEKIRAERISSQENWGWTFCDTERNDVLIFWKEL